MTWFLDAGLGAAAVGFAAGVCVPQVIARLPEPPPDEDKDETETEGEEPKRLYAEVAARPGLRWYTAAAGAGAGGLLGARLGWDPALLFLVYLVPSCVALAVVDWHTRFLPTRLIAPSYVVVGALVVVAWALAGDTMALVRSLVGWVASFGFFFVQWFIYPRGLGYGDVRLSGLLGMALGWAPLGDGRLRRTHARRGGRRDAVAAARDPATVLRVRAVPGAWCATGRSVLRRARDGVRRRGAGGG